jgi:hypothetical protein
VTLSDNVEIMCGRFLALKSPDEIARWFATRNATPNSRPRYNVAPTQDILAVRFNPETKERTLDALRWGLVRTLALYGMTLAEVVDLYRVSADVIERIVGAGAKGTHR